MDRVSDEKMMYNEYRVVGNFREYDHGLYFTDHEKALHNARVLNTFYQNLSGNVYSVWFEPVSWEDFAAAYGGVMPVMLRKKLK